MPTTSRRRLFISTLAIRVQTPCRARSYQTNVLIGPAELSPQILTDTLPIAVHGSWHTCTIFQGAVLARWRYMSGEERRRPSQALHLPIQWQTLRQSAVQLNGAMVS